MEIRVEKIVSVEFRHDYFKDANTDWLENWPKGYSAFGLPNVKPSKWTIKKLEDLGLFLKSTEKGFDIYAEVKSVGNKFFVKRPSQDNIELNFFVFARDARWLNQTRQNQEKTGLAYFSNYIGFKTGGSESAYFLHNEIPDAAAGTKAPGSLARKTNKVYEATELTTTQPPGSKWADLGTHQNFTTMSNQLKTINKSLLLVGGPFAGKTVDIKNVFGEVVLTETIEGTSTEVQLNIDIESLPEGKYSYEIDNVKQEDFWLQKSNADALGVVQLVLLGKPSALPPAFLLDQEWLPIGNGSSAVDTGEINPKTFVLHFLPNRAKWKYILNKELTIDPADISAAGYQKLSNTTFLSNNSITLNKEAKGADFGLENRFPAPANNVLKTLKNGSDEVENYVTEIFVNV